MHALGRIPHAFGLAFLLMVALLTPSRAHALPVSNLVANGDFEAGSSGFGSDYEPRANDVATGGSYVVVTNPDRALSGFIYRTDHTTGAGKMLVANGAVEPGKVVWRQSVMVQPGQVYRFAVWVANLYVGADTPQIALRINGQQIGDPVRLRTIPAGPWTEVYALWSSGDAASAQLEIVDLEQAPFGNDFALDDIFFGLGQLGVASLTPDQVVAPGESVTLSVMPVGPGPYTFQWRHNGADIPGATADVLGLDKVAPSDTGYYTVVIRNGEQTYVSSPIAVRLQGTTAVAIPDPQLEAAIRLALSKPEGALLVSDLEALRNLDLSGRKVATLAGLEAAAGLTSLSLSDTLVRSLAPVEGLIGLRELRFSAPGLVDWSILLRDRFPVLQNFAAPNGATTDIEWLRQAPMLESLDLSHNRIADVSPILSQKRLRTLWLHGNWFSDIAPLAAMSPLEYLGISNCYLDLAEGSPAAQVLSHLSSAGGSQEVNPQRTLPEGVPHVPAQSVFAGDAFTTHLVASAAAAGGTVQSVVVRSSNQTLLSDSALEVRGRGASWSVKGVTPHGAEGIAGLVIEVHRVGGGVETYPVTLSVFARSESAAYIEAEDYDFGHGQTLTEGSIGMLGAYSGGSFRGLGGVADRGVDWNDSGSPSGSSYRTGPAANIFELPRGFSPEAVSRGQFEVEVNHEIRWGASQSWQNYTRTFSPGFYNVYAVHTVLPATATSSLSKVFAGVGSQGQSVKSVGSFRWDGGQTEVEFAEKVVPLTTPDGTLASVYLGGQSTLRYTFGNSVGGFDYMAFVPAPPADPGIAQLPADQIASVGGSLTLSVTPTGTGPFTFQWRKDGVDLAGKVGDSLVLQNLGVPDTGSYSVVVRNAIGFYESEPIRVSFPKDTPVKFADAGLEVAVRAGLGLAEEAPVTVGAMEGLTALSADGRDVQSLEGLQAAVSLQTFTARRGRITDLRPLAGLTLLNTLVLDANRIQDLRPIARLTALVSLILDYNPIARLEPLARMPELLYLHLSSTDLRDFSSLTPTAFPKLQELEVAANAISSLSSLQWIAPQLTALSLQGNTFTEFGPELRFTKLRFLNVATTRLKDFSVLNATRFPKLENLHAHINPQLHSLDWVAALPNLTYLNVSMSPVTDCRAVAGLHKLRGLDLRACWLSDISALANLLPLEVLSVEGNYLDVSPGSVAREILLSLVTPTGSLAFESQNPSPPGVDGLADQSSTAGIPVPSIPVRISTPDRVSDLASIEVTSSNPALISTEGVRITGDGVVRALDLTPQPGVSGAAQITLTVRHHTGPAVTGNFWLRADSGRWTVLDRVGNAGMALVGTVDFSGPGGGRTGNASDYSLDFGLGRGHGAGVAAGADFLSRAVGGDSFTISLWQRLRELGDGTTLLQAYSPWAGLSGIRVHFPWPDGTVYYDTAGCCDPNGSRIFKSISDFPAYSGSPDWWKAWHHVAFVKDGSSKRIYIDGALFAEGVNNGSVSLPFEYFVIGSMDWTTPPHGWVDDVAVYEAPLDAVAVQSLASGSDPRTQAGLTAYWDFNEPPPPAGQPDFDRPLAFENFDSTPEGSLPAGWSVVNHTETDVAVQDLDQPHSDTFKNWVVISRDRVSAIGTNGRWDANRRLQVASNQSFNGRPVDRLINGNFIYAESDVRQGSQVQYLFTPDFALGGRTGIYVSFHSIYEQNQDSVGAVEYSVDRGATWLPVVYYLDTPDIVKAGDGSADGAATFAAARPDTAQYVDPITGQTVGLRYGDFIGVTPDRWGLLGSYISGRVNDDMVESKRVETFRLPAADGQQQVRFRFAQAGTASWYFGIDDFGLYATPNGDLPALAPELAAVIAAELGIVDRPVEEADLLALTQLRLAGKGVKSLAGLEAAVNLTLLDLTPDGGLPADAPERNLDLSPLTRMPQLRTLDVSGLALRSIEFLRGLPQLTSLAGRNYPAVAAIRDFSPLASLSRLESLIWENQGLADTSVLTPCTSLRSLSLGNNPVVDASPLGSLTGLNSLSLFGTRLNSLRFLERLTNIAAMDLSSPAVPSLRDEDFASLRPLVNLYYLILVGQPIHTASSVAPFLNPAVMRQLHMNNCPVADGEAFRELRELTNLSLAGAPLTSLGFLTPLEKLQSLDLSGSLSNPVIPPEGWAPVGALRALTSLSLAGRQLRDVGFLANHPSLVTLWLNNTRVADLAPLATVRTLTQVLVSGSLVTDLRPMLALPALTYLETAGLWLQPPALTGGQDVPAALAARGVGGISVQTLPIPLAVPSRGMLPLNTTGLQPGLVGQIHWGGPADNALMRAEQSLAGSNGPNAAPPKFIDGGAVNYNDDTSFIGRFAPDRGFPNLPGRFHDAVSMSLSGYVALRAGNYVVGVNSDDGFALSSGFDPIFRPTTDPSIWEPNPDSAVLGKWDGGRGATDSMFMIHVDEDGLYPLRLLWEEGGGAASLEWWMIDLNQPEGSRRASLVNDPTDAASAKVYYLPSEGNTAPTIVAGAVPFVEAGVSRTFRFPFQVGDAETPLQDVLASMSVGVTSRTPSIIPQAALVLHRGPDGFEVEVTQNGLGSGVARVLISARDSGGLTSELEVPVTVVGLQNTVGYLHREIYENIPGSTVADLLASSSFPGAPSFVELVTVPEVRDYADNYGQRLSAYLMPPVTGDYVFYISADDEAQLWLSTDEEPAHKVLLAREPLWNGFRAYQSTFNRTPSAPENRSQAVHLEHGRAYYFEVLQKEGGGGDHVEVTWQPPGFGTPTDGAEPIPGIFFSANKPTPEQASYAALPGVGAEPADLLTVEGTAAGFEVTPTGIAPFSFQWRRNGVNLDGQTASSLAIPQVRLEDTGDYDVVIRNAYGVFQSRAARLQLKPVPLVSPGLFSLVGSATLPGGVLRLTPSADYQAGAAWLRQSQPVGDGFDSVFQFQITQPTGTGADGFAFVIQSVGPDAIGTTGAGIGYSGLAPSLAVEFDTWDNGPGFDPNGNHVSVQVRGGVDAPNSLGNTGTGLRVTLDDGLLHTARVRYAGGQLSVFVDDFTTPVLTVNVNLQDYVTLVNGRAFVGFVGATGGFANVHEIVSWRFQPAGVTPPVIQQAPDPLQYLFLDQVARLEVLAPGYPLQFVWSKEGTILENAGRIQGADTGALVLNGVVPGDAGIYGVRVFNSAGTAEAGPFTVTVRPTTAPAGLGRALREVYPNIAGVSVADLRASPAFPDHPSLVEFVPAFEAAGLGDAYGQRISALLWPPVTGDYRFFIASDDGGELYLSTDESPAHKALIAREPVWAPFRDYLDSFNRNPAAPENRSAVIHLEAGRGYYMEALQKEGGGGDHVSVAWQLPGGAEPANGSAPISGTFLSSPDPLLRAPLIVRSPTVVELTPGFLNTVPVNVAGVGVSYQWLRDGSEVPEGVRFAGTHSPTLMVLAAGAPDAGTYRLRATNAAGSVETDPISFTIRPPESFNLLNANSRVTPDPEAPGFSVKVHQVSVTQPNSLLRAERQLLGLLVDSGGTALPNIADLSGAGPDGRFVVPGVANWNNFLDLPGQFSGDTAIPGIPGVTGSLNNAAFEIVTYLDLPQGVVRMGVTSDDGFETATENIRDVLLRNVTGRFDGIRGAGETIFEFYVPEAGIYPFRTVWEQGDGGSSFEWYTFKPDGTRVLLNDLANGGVRAYRRLPAAPTAPAVALVDPPTDAVNVPLRSPLTVVLLDPLGAVDAATLRLTIDGTPQAASLARLGERIVVSCTPSTPFAPDAYVTAALSYTETGKEPRTAAWQFKTTPIALNTLFIEAEDFDFGKGQWVRDVPIGMTGVYSGGAYQGRGSGVNGTPGDGSDLGVDYFELAPVNSGPDYRLGTGVDIVSLPTGGGQAFRGDFELQQNYKLGWNDAGDWYNYTRELPPVLQQYRVFASLSSAGLPIAGDLGRVTAGVGTAAQTVEPLGQFRASATGDWNAFTMVELKDESGVPVQPFLSGLNTFRFTTLPGNLDFDYLAFVPIPGTAVPRPEIVARPLPLSVFVGGEVRFSVEATGPETLTYQWKKGPNELPGETSPSLFIAAAKLEDAGNYSVMVRNRGGAVESAPVALQVKTFTGPPVEFRVADGAVGPHGSLSLPIKVNGFNNVGSFQFSVRWDPSLLGVVSAASGALDGLTGGNFNLSPANGTLLVSWDDPAGTGKTLATGSTLLTLNFTSLGTPGTTTDVSVTGTPTLIEVVGGDLNPLPYATGKGVVTFLSTVDLSGAVRFYGNNSLLVPGVEIALAGGVSKSMVTGTGGDYQFTVNAGADYTLAASKLAESPGSQGVTTLDITLVRRQILGITPLDTPYKLLAADVNGSGSVTTLDITLMRRVILGITNNFPGGAWVFVPAGTTFPTPAAPWSFESTRRFTGLAQSLNSQDFIGVRKGDVNGSWTPASIPPPPPEAGPESPSTGQQTSLEVPKWQSLSSPRLTPVASSTASAARLRVEPGVRREDGLLEVPVRLRGQGAFSSVQFSLAWNPSSFEWVGVAGSDLAGFGEGNINPLMATSSGRLSVSWDHPSGQGTVLPLSGIDVLRLVFRARGTKATASTIRIASAPTPVEVVTDAGPVGAGLENGWMQIGYSGSDAGLRLPTLKRGAAELHVPTWVGGRSVIEFSRALGSDSWSVLESIEGDGEIHVLPVVPNHSETYYRMRWEP